MKARFENSLAPGFLHACPFLHAVSFSSQLTLFQGSVTLVWFLFPKDWQAGEDSRRPRNAHCALTTVEPAF